MARKSTSNGRKFEKEIVELLNKLNVDYEEQPSIFPDRISITVTPDFVIRIPGKKPLYIFAQQDFWNGGQQSDRFGHVVQMDRFVWEQNDVFYCLKHPGGNKPDAKLKTMKQQLKHKLYEDLARRLVVGGLDALEELIRGLMS